MRDSANVAPVSSAGIMLLSARALRAIRSFGTPFLGFGFSRYNVLVACDVFDFSSSRSRSLHWHLLGDTAQHEYVTLWRSRSPPHRKSARFGSDTYAMDSRSASTLKLLGRCQCCIFMLVWKWVVDPFVELSPVLRLKKIRIFRSLYHTNPAHILVNVNSGC